jgi:hypothetical protein
VNPGLCQDLEHNTAAAAINLIRLDAWWTGKPLDRTRTTHLQRLDLAALNSKIRASISQQDPECPQGRSICSN